MSRPRHTYRVAAWWTSGRSGLAKSNITPNAIHFTSSKEFGGLEGRWTPEELLLATFAGCFTTALRSISRNAGLDIIDLQVEASGTVRKSECCHDFRAIVIRSNLKIARSEERERALKLLKKAERLCLVSRALDIPLIFEPKIEVIEAVFSLPGW
jgi:organic hydroperoxide reductase OsmC/OhrA